MSGSDQLQLSFHATVPLSDAELAQVEASAKSQEASVLAWFALYDELEFTPSEILRALIKTQRLHRNTPVTSVRRAISNLTKYGWLEKLSKTRKGPAGKPEHAWRFKQSDSN